MIQANVIFFEDGPELLRQCFESLLGKVDSIIAIDGPFAEFPHESLISKDGCRELALEYANEVISKTDKAWSNQAEKRNAYFEATDEGIDFHFVIDADEVLIGKFDCILGPYPHQDIFNIDFDDCFSDGMILHCPRPRLFRHYPGLHYNQKHNYIYIDDAPYIPAEDKREFPILPGCKIAHHPYKRGVERLERDGFYMRTRAENKINLNARG